MATSRTQSSSYHFFHNKTLFAYLMLVGTQHSSMTSDQPDYQTDYKESNELKNKHAKAQIRTVVVRMQLK